MMTKSQLRVLVQQRLRFSAVGRNEFHWFSSVKKQIQSKPNKIRIAITIIHTRSEIPLLECRLSGFKENIQRFDHSSPPTSWSTKISRESEDTWGVRRRRKAGWGRGGRGGRGRGGRRGRRRHPRRRDSCRVRCWGLSRRSPSLWPPEPRPIWSPFELLLLLLLLREEIVSEGKLSASWNWTQEEIGVILINSDTE